MFKMPSPPCRIPAKRRLSPLLLIPLLALAGCGGGGDSGGNTGPGPNPNTFTITGVVQNANGAGVRGFVVVFDGSQTLRATSDTTGNFTVAIPPSAITGSDHLYVYDPSGALAVIDNISPSASGTTYDAGTIVVGPPPPPAP